MSKDNQLSERLSRLGEALSAQPSVAEDVMRRIEPMAKPARPGHYRLRRYIMKPTIAVAASVLMGVAVWFVLVGRPGTLYAQVIAALEQANSVHITVDVLRDEQWEKGWEIWYQRGTGVVQSRQP